jgi:hypothetical protein
MSLLSRYAAYRVNFGACDERLFPHIISTRVIFLPSVSAKLTKE